MVEKDALAEKVFALLKGNGFQIKIFDVDGNETTDPSTGRRFFVLSPNIMVTIDDDSNSIEFSKGNDVDDSIDIVQKNIRKLADEFLMNSKIKVFGKAIQPRDYSYQAKNNSTVSESITGLTSFEAMILRELSYSTLISAKALYESFKQTPAEQFSQTLHRLLKQGLIEVNQKSLISISKKGLSEMNRILAESFSKMFGSARTSHQTLENVRILVRHKTPIDENIRGARSRAISAIFLESNGERFRFPYNNLSGARAMAQHMAHGGTMSDKVGAFISESTGNLLKLQSFNRYVTTNKLINEDSSGIVDTVKENIETIRTDLRKLTGSKTYETVKARLETFEREALAEDDTSSLKDLFTIRRFDEKFEGVLPIIKQLVQEKDTFHKRIEEAASNVINLRRESINTTPMFEFAGENARLGFKINELALRIVENDELAGFINKIGTKLCKEGIVNDFEKAVLTQVLENVRVESAGTSKEIKESTDLEDFFNRFDYNFM